MIAAPPDPRLAAVLHFANGARAQLGLAAVSALRGGERVNPWFCPICTTIGQDAPRDVEPEFDGTTLRVWRRGTRLLYLMRPAPDEVVEWSEEFDRGLHADLERERAR